MAFSTSNGYYKPTLNLYLAKSASVAAITASSTYKVALFTNNIGTMAYDTDQYYNAGVYASNEFVGTNYTTGGGTDGAIAFTQDVSGGLARVKAAAATVFNTLTYTTNGAQGCVIYDAVSGTSVTRPLVGAFYFGAVALQPVAGDLTITWNSGTPFTVLTFG